MAVFHQAFCFDPAMFHKNLEHSSASAGELHVDQLRKLARSVIDSATGDTKEYLRLLCIDDSCLESVDDNTTQFTDWYLAALGRYVYSASPVSNLSFAALEVALPTLGWTTQEVRLLLIGQSIYSLAESSGVRAFASVCSRGVRHVSWLSHENVVSLISKLMLAAGQFENPSQSMLDALFVLPKYFFSLHEPSVILHDAHVEIVKRMDTARKSNAALVLINDVNSYQQRPGPDPV